MSTRAQIREAYREDKQHPPYLLQLPRPPQGKPETTQFNHFHEALQNALGTDYASREVRPQEIKKDHTPSSS
jgi:hypothetical protein